MANVLKDEKKPQIIALGRLGWSLRKIQEATRVRRETISAYLRGAGGEIWPPGRWKPEGKAKPAIEVITGSEAAKPAIPESGGQPNFRPDANPNPDPENLSTKGRAKATSKPAIAVITDFGVGLSGKEPENSRGTGSASTCEPYREIIELGLSRDRNARAIWQDLVSDHGFRGGYQSVRRFAYKLRGAQVPPARAVIHTAPGEEGQVDYRSGPMVREAQRILSKHIRLLFVLQFLIVLLGMGVMHGLMPILTSETFPTKFRYSGSGISFGLAGVLGGMIAPSLLARLIGEDVLHKWYYVPDVYAVYGTAAMIALLFLRETRDIKFEDLDNPASNVSAPRPSAAAANTSVLENTKIQVTPVGDRP